MLTKSKNFWVLVAYVACCTQTLCWSQKDLRRLAEKHELHEFDEFEV